MESIHLFGAETVGNAGYNMKAAAEDMNRAASVIEEALRQQRMFMEDFITRFEMAVEKGRM